MGHFALAVSPVLPDRKDLNIIQVLAVARQGELPTL